MQRRRRLLPRFVFAVCYLVGVSRLASAKDFFRNLLVVRGGSSQDYPPNYGADNRQDHYSYQYEQNTQGYGYDSYADSQAYGYSQPYADSQQYYGYPEEPQTPIDQQNDLPPGWTEHLWEDRPYWYNHIDGTSSWVHPRELEQAPQDQPVPYGEPPQYQEETQAQEEAPPLEETVAGDATAEAAAAAAVGEEAEAAVGGEERGPAAAAAAEDQVEGEEEVQGAYAELVAPEGPAIGEEEAPEGSERASKNELDMMYNQNQGQEDPPSPPHEGYEDSYSQSQGYYGDPYSHPGYEQQQAYAPHPGAYPQDAAGYYAPQQFPQQEGGYGQDPQAAYPPQPAAYDQYYGQAAVPESGAPPPAGTPAAAAEESAAVAAAAAAAAAAKEEEQAAAAAAAVRAAEEEAEAARAALAEAEARTAARGAEAEEAQAALAGAREALARLAEEEALGRALQKNLTRRAERLEDAKLGLERQVFNLTTRYEKVLEELETATSELATARETGAAAEAERAELEGLLEDALDEVAALDEERARLARRAAAARAAQERGPSFLRRLLDEYVLAALPEGLRRGPSPLAEAVRELNATLERQVANNTRLAGVLESKDSLIDELNERVDFFEQAAARRKKKFRHLKHEAQGLTDALAAKDAEAARARAAAAGALAQARGANATAEALRARAAALAGDNRRLGGLVAEMENTAALARSTAEGHLKTISDLRSTLEVRADAVEHLTAELEKLRGSASQSDGLSVDVNDAEAPPGLSPEEKTPVHGTPPGFEELESNTEDNFVDASTGEDHYGIVADDDDGWDGYNHSNDIGQAPITTFKEDSPAATLHHVKPLQYPAEHTDIQKKTAYNLPHARGRPYSIATYHASSSTTTTPSGLDDQPQQLLAEGDIIAAAESTSSPSSSVHHEEDEDYQKIEDGCCPVITDNSSSDDSPTINLNSDVNEISQSDDDTTFVVDGMAPLPGNGDEVEEEDVSCQKKKKKWWVFW